MKTVQHESMGERLGELNDQMGRGIGVANPRVAEMLQVRLPVVSEPLLGLQLAFVKLGRVRSLLEEHPVKIGLLAVQLHHRQHEFA